jgi:hypothetical protein
VLRWVARDLCPDRREHVGLAVTSAPNQKWPKGFCSRGCFASAVTRQSPFPKSSQLLSDGRALRSPESALPTTALVYQREVQSAGVRGARLQATRALHSYMTVDSSQYRVSYDGLCIGGTVAKAHGEPSL